MSDFESTGLLPAIVAEDVLRQRGITDLSLIDYVEDRTERVYLHNSSFRKRVNSATARQVYRAFVEHWINGEHKRRLKLSQTGVPT